MTLWEAINKALSHSDYWWPCQKNEGFGGSSFISFATAFNVALAKWEPLHKSLLDVRNQSKELFTQRIEKESATILLLDERYAPRTEISREVCLDYANDVLNWNERAWLMIRYGAAVTALLGASALFFQLSLGCQGLWLAVPPLLTWLCVKISRMRMQWFIRSHYSHTLKHLKKEAEKTANTDKAKLASDLDQQLGTP